MICCSLEGLECLCMHVLRTAFATQNLYQRPGAKRGLMNGPSPTFHSTPPLRRDPSDADPPSVEQARELGLYWIRRWIAEAEAQAPNEIRFVEPEDHEW